MMATFGECVRQYRQRLGMTQKNLAEWSDLSASHLNRIENGSRQPPEVAKVLAIVSALYLANEEAEELVQLAGYAPIVLQTGAGLTLSGPTIGTQPTQDRLVAALAKLPPSVRHKITEAIVLLVESLESVNAPVDDSPVAKERRRDHAK